MKCKVYKPEGEFKYRLQITELGDNYGKVVIEGTDNKKLQAIARKLRADKINMFNL